MYDTENKKDKGGLGTSLGKLILESLLQAPLLWNMNIEVVHVERAWYIFSCEQHLAGREGVERSVGIPEDSEQEKEQKYRTNY